MSTCDLYIIATDSFSHIMSTKVVKSIVKEKAGWIMNPRTGRFVKLCNANRYGIVLSTKRPTPTPPEKNDFVIENLDIKLDDIICVVFAHCDIQTQRNMLMSSKMIRNMVDNTPVKEAFENMKTIRRIMCDKFVNGCLGPNVVLCHRNVNWMNPKDRTCCKIGRITLTYVKYMNKCVHRHHFELDVDGDTTRRTIYYRPSFTSETFASLNDLFQSEVYLKVCELYLAILHHFGPDQMVLSMFGPPLKEELPKPATTGKRPTFEDIEMLLKEFSITV